MGRAFIAGVGIFPFGRHPHTYFQMGAVAAIQALDDAGIEARSVDVSLVANVSEGMAKGQRVMQEVGLTGAPIIAVESACASSGSSLMLAADLVASGQRDVILCVGVEKAARGYIPRSGYDDWQISTGLGANPAYFALGAYQLLNERGATVEDLADISVKNHANAVENPNAMYRKSVSREEVLGSKMVCDPLTLLMLCSPNEGAAAAVLMSEDAVKRFGVRDAVELRAVTLASATEDSWFVGSSSHLPRESSDLTRRAVRAAYEKAGIGPDDLSLVECQDTDAASELLAYSDLGLCAQGEEAKILQAGETSMGGRLPVNASGGLLSKGEPLGASGLGQMHELVTQLRGRAGSRQVEGANVGLGHVMGAGQTASVAIVSR